MNRKACSIAGLLLASLIYVVVNGDQCKHPTEAALAEHINTKVSPKGGVHAGEYGKINGVKEFGDCVKACCKDSRCNAVFYNKEACLTIHCTTDELCSPGEPSDSLEDAVLVNLRTVAETKAANVEAEREKKAEMNSPHIVACEVGLLECSTNEECRVPDNKPRAKSGTCQCIDGYTRKSVSSNCVLSASDSQSTAVPSSASATVEVPSPATTVEVPSPTATVEVPSSAVTIVEVPSPATTVKAPPATAAEIAVPPPLKPTNSTIATNTTVIPTTTTSPSTTALKVITLAVSAGDNRVLKYPDNSVKLTAFALPAPEDGEVYTYHWTMLEKPSGEEVGHSKDTDKQELQLSELVVGFYSLSVEVKGPNKYGIDVVNITVEPAPTVNQKPVAVIQPSVLTMKEDTAGILDGADSTDDDTGITYLWEIVSGPISEPLKSNEGAMLKLKDLSPGNYSVRLTVSDKEGETNSTLATVIVEEAVDYRPKANAGDDKIVTLPYNSVTLYGNASSDDKGIVSYEWNAKAGDVSADTDGVDTAVLHLSHLREGVYTYELEVTDTKGQKDTDVAHVFVKASQNKAPIADVEFNTTMVEPGAGVVLDGSPSTDDQLITKYRWKQSSGPTHAKIDNPDRATASVDDLVKGDYVFELSVFDAEDLKDSVSVTVLVRSAVDQKPVANAGNDMTVTLPMDIIRLDGGKSINVGSNPSWRWTRGDDSPGAGHVVNGSDSQQVLLLSNLVTGAYTFTLTVRDEEGAESSDTVTIHVQPDPQQNNLVELSLDTSIETFTEKHKKNLAVQLALMLTSPAYIGDPTVKITGIYPDYHNGKLVVLFLVEDKQASGESVVRNGTEVTSLLLKKLDKGRDLLGFRVSQVDTVVCQNECSGHGYCDQFSKTCVCEAFWMPNYAVAKWSGESNCDWSILYVVITVLASIFIFIILIWLCVCCTRRCKRTRGRRKHTYKLLHDIEEMENEEKLAKKKRSNITAGTGSIFLSETDLSSEEDTLFMTGGDNRNLHKPEDNLVKANNLKNKLRA